MDYSAFAKGWQQKGERNRQSRLDNLKLWNEYKRTNPFADMTALQDYRDSLAGGSNYLGATLPTNNVLEDLAKRNKANYNQDMLERTYGNMEARAKVVGTMQGDIDNAILSSGGQDMSNAAEAFLAQYPEMAQAPDVSKRVRAQFSEGRFNALKIQAIENTLPTASRLIKANPNMDADDLAAATDLPKNIARGLLTRAKEQLRQTNLDWSLKHRETLLNRAWELSKDGVMLPRAAIEAALKEIGGNQEIDDDILDGWEEILQKREEKANEQQRKDNVDWSLRHQEGIISRAYELAKDGIRTSDEALEEVLKAVGIVKKNNYGHLTGETRVPEETLKNWKAILDERVKRYQTAEEERKSTEDSTQLTRLTSALHGDKNAMSYVVQNDDDGLLEYFNQHYWMTLPRHVRERIDGDTNLKNNFMDQLLNAVFRRGAHAQSNVVDSAYEKFQAGQQAALTSATEANVASAVAHFGGEKNANHPHIKAGDHTDKNPAYHSNATTVVQTLAKQYNMSPVALQTLQEVFAKTPSTTSLPELLKAGAMALHNAGILSAGVANESRANLAALETGRHLPVQRFDSWHSNKFTVINKIVNDGNKAIDKILASSKSPQDKIRELTVAHKMIESKYKQVGTEMRYAKQHALGDDSWIKIERDARGWSDNDHNKLEEMMRKNFDLTSNDVQKQIARLTEKLPPPATPGKKPRSKVYPNSVSQPGSGSGDTSQAERWFDKWSSAQSAGMDLYKWLDPYKRETAPLGLLFTNQTDEEIKAKRQIVDFVEAAGGTTALANRIFELHGPNAEGGSVEKAATFVKNFMEDPTKVMRENPEWLRQK